MSAESRARATEVRRQRLLRDPEYAERHARSVFDANLRRKYGVTLEWYEARFVEQSGVCAICGRPPTTKRLGVDHDHVTGEPRKLLCDACNRGIGFLRDDPALLWRAAEYLDGFRRNG